MSLFDFDRLYSYVKGIMMSEGRQSAVDLLSDWNDTLLEMSSAGLDVSLIKNQLDGVASQLNLH